MSSRPRRAAISALVTIALSACGGGDGDGGDPPGGATKTIEIEAAEFSFSGDPGVGIVAGDTIQFIVSNVGQLTHEMQVLDGTNRVLGKTGRIPPGGQDQVRVEFREAGTYQVICDIDDHFTLGQRAQFVVAEP